MDGLPNLAVHAGFVSKDKMTLLALRLRKNHMDVFFRNSYFGHGRPNKIEHPCSVLEAKAKRRFCLGG